MKKPGRRRLSHADKPSLQTRESDLPYPPPIERGHRRSRFLVLAGGSLVLTFWWFFFAFYLGEDRADRRKPYRSGLDHEALGTVPGEFEPQQAILLAWPRAVGSESSRDPHDEFKNLDRIYCDVVRALSGSTATILLVEDPRTEDHVRRLLSEARVPWDRVRLFQVPFESQWIRDFGPMEAPTRDGSWALIDAEYVDGPAGVYPHEDRLPSELGKLLGMRTVRAPLSIHHGNLLSNGRGVCLATQRLVEENIGRGYDADDVRRVLKTFYGAKEVVFLEALDGEPTGHVDMFATFTSSNTVVIGAYPQEYDPVNAAILHRNARRLASSLAPSGPLEITRVPMPRRVPTRSGEFWPTYTNVVYGNDVVLVPVYPGWDPAGESSALAVYRRLLPGRKVVGINAVSVLRWGGGIHCMTMNLPSLAKGVRTAIEGGPRP